MRRVSGVDPSLTSTGIAVVTVTEAAGGGTHDRIGGRLLLTTGIVRSDVVRDEDMHPAVYEAARVADIVDQVCTSVAGSEVVCVESPALMSRTGKALERGHLFFSLMAALTARRIPVSTLTPGQLKRRATGNGRADKDAVLAAVRGAWAHCGWSDRPASGRHDRADAAALAWCAAVDRGLGGDERALPHLAA